MENKTEKDKESKSKEESELEEEIKEEEKETKNEEFQEFFEHPIETPIIEDFSPSLEKINISPEVPIRLEQELTGSSFKKENEEDEIKYGTNLYKKEEDIKYQTKGTRTFAPKRTEIENLGKENFFQKQNVGFIQSNEVPKSKEEYITPEHQKIEELGRNENPFKSKTTKYKALK